MGDWTDTKLSTLVVFGNGESRPKSRGKIPVYGGNGILGYSADSNYEGEIIVIGRVGAYCGATYYENKPIWVSDNALSARPKADNHAKYIYYLLKSLNLNQHAQGSSHPLLTQTLLNNLDVKTTLDPNIQKATAEVLTSFDEKIDLLHRQNKTLEALADALFRYTFIDNVQDKWKTFRVFDIAQHIKKSRNPAAEPDKTFAHYSIPSYDKHQRPRIQLGAGIKSNKYVVEPNSVLVSKLNPRFPRIWHINHKLPENAICSTEFQVISPTIPENIGFLYFLFRSEAVREALIMAASGTSGSHQRVRPDDIMDIEFQSSGDKHITEFSLKVSPFLDKMEHNQSEILSLEKLRDTLLPKLISGEVRVHYDEVV